MADKRQDFESRIIQAPESEYWYNELIGANDGWTEYGKYNFDGLPDAEKVELIVFAWNDIDYLATTKKIAKSLGIGIKEAKKAIKEAKANGLIKVMPAFSENTGLLCGSGYELAKNFYCLYHQYPASIGGL